ncbi:hypothetical protein ACFL03_08025 [Thermodesulfobacteriota bacterium]
MAEGEPVRARGMDAPSQSENFNPLSTICRTCGAGTGIVQNGAVFKDLASLVEEQEDLSFHGFATKTYFTSIEHHLFLNSSLTYQWIGFRLKRYIFLTGIAIFMTGLIFFQIIKKKLNSYSGFHKYVPIDSVLFIFN